MFGPQIDKIIILQVCDKKCVIVALYWIELANEEALSKVVDVEIGV